MEEMIKAVIDKAVTKIVGESASEDLRLACDKAFTQGALFGIEVAEPEIRAAKARISELEDEVFVLKQEIRAHS